MVEILHLMPPNRPPALQSTSHLCNSVHCKDHCTEMGNATFSGYAHCILNCSHELGTSLTSVPQSTHPPSFRVILHAKEATSSKVITSSYPSAQKRYCNRREADARWCCKAKRLASSEVQKSCWKVVTARKIHPVRCIGVFVKRPSQRSKAKQSNVETFFAVKHLHVPP